MEGKAGSRKAGMPCPEALGWEDFSKAAEGAQQRTGVLATLITEVTISPVALKFSTHPHPSRKIPSPIPALPSSRTFAASVSGSVLCCILNHQPKDPSFLQKNKQGSCVLNNISSGTMI